MAVVLDTRTNRTNAKEFPLAIRFTVGTQLLYHRVSGSYTEKQFSDIAAATRSGSDNYREQKKWQDAYAEKYRKLLQSLNPGGPLTFEMVRTAVQNNNVQAVEHEDDMSFIRVWEDYIHHLKTDNHGEQFSTGESYECGLKKFKQILGDNAISGFNISAAEIQKWKDGMLNGIPGPKGTTVGKISKSTAGIYLRNCRTIWNKCVAMGYLQDVPYVFSNKKSKATVAIPPTATRKNEFLNIQQMTQLYHVFINKEYPSDWKEDYTQRAHSSLGLFLVQYLCNGFNMADAAELTYDDHYYQTGGRAFHFFRKKTAGRSKDGAEVIVPIIEPLRLVLNDIAAPPERDGYVFPDILQGASTAKAKDAKVSLANANVKSHLRKIVHEVLHWDRSIRPSGTWARHSFATNMRYAGVSMDYISESMGHSAKDHAVTQLYMEHYPLETQMQNNMKLLNLNTESTERQMLLNRLAQLSDDELKHLLA